MRTPVGWVTANMLYDKFPGIPPAESPLRSVFYFVYLDRQRASLLATHATVQAILLGDAEKQDPAIDAYERYYKQVFPFLDRAENPKATKDHANLLAFVAKPSKIDLRPIYKAKVDEAKKRVSIRKFQLKPQMPGV